MKTTTLLRRLIAPSILFFSFPFFYLLVVLLMSPDTENTTLFAPPPNDDCVSASTIIIPDGGFATGVFQSEVFDLTDATIDDPDEMFDLIIEENGLNDKTMWYKFTIPTSRYVYLQLKQNDVIINAGDVGFTIYDTEDCPAYPNPSLGVLTIDALAGTGKECFLPGTYYVQVCGDDSANGELFLELTVSNNFQGTGGAAYDFPSEAYNFGTISNAASINYELKCHSIDNIEEYDCLPVSTPEDFTQSSWHVFTTGSAFELTSIVVDNIGSMPDDVGYRIYEGDVLTNPVASLPVVESCLFLDQKGNLRVREYVCDTLLKASTTYSFELLFDKLSEHSNMSVQVCQKGGQADASPVPVDDLVAATNKLGVLPSSQGGVTTYLIDTFSCNSSLDLAENICGSVNPAGGLINGSINYDLVAWATFELESDATVTFSYSGISNQYRFTRIFNKNISDDCGEIDAINDLYSAFVGSPEKIFCMPAGQYSIQMLATYADPYQPDNFSFCSSGSLGRPVNLAIELESVQDISDFGLWDALAFDPINNFNPLQNEIVYTAEEDTFGCRNTVIPEGGTCTNREKGIYRMFKIGDADGDMLADSGMIHFSNLLTNNSNDIHYKIYADNLPDLAVAQNVFTENEEITGATDFLEGGCIEFYSGTRGYYCITPGDYTFAAFGSTPQIGKIDQPKVEFRILNTKHPSRAEAEDMGDILTDTIIVTNEICGVEVFDTLIPEGSIISTRDTFSCLDNPATIGGIAPCGSATKLVYRQFYLSESRVVRISSSDTDVRLNLFTGQANDPLDPPLIPWSGDNETSTPWTSCFYNQRTDPCDPLTPGWYTVVAYGDGASFDDPFYNVNGERGNLGRGYTIQIQHEPLPDEECDSPEDACFANDCMPTDWNFAQAAEDYPYTQLQYIIGSINFGCIPDTAWSDHPITPCDPEEMFSIYEIFTITEPSFVRISGIPSGLNTVLFPFDASIDPSLLGSETPVYPCSDPNYGERQICNLQAGTYTLVIFRDADDNTTITPVVYVEKTGISRFDHALHAYDFGLIPGGGTPIFGKPLDVHPLNPNLPPSNDFIYCSTGAQETDPINDMCNPGQQGYVEYNPLVYAESINNPLYTDLIPGNGGNQYATRRNLWYTFVLNGSGTATISVNTSPNGGSNYVPRMNLYRSDVDGTIPFDDVVLNGEVDSTLTDGLVHEISNNIETNGILYCNTHTSSMGFDKILCEMEDTVRYYLMVTMWSNNNNPIEPNQQVEVSIAYDDNISYAARYDNFDEANVINGLNQDMPPYSTDSLDPGVYVGAPASLECATRVPSDPSNCGSYTRSVWYKFEASGTGTVYLAHMEDSIPGTEDASPDMQLYRETIPDDVNSLVEVDLGNFYSSHPNNNTGHDWQEGCYEAGTYYIFWMDCGNDFSIFPQYRPIVWLSESLGDFCENAIEIDILGTGTFEGVARVDCHTIGTDFGEDGSNMSCLNGPEGYKSSWFKVHFDSIAKFDVGFSLDGDLYNQNGASLDFEDIAQWRILRGSCQGMTTGPCFSSGGTIDYNCLLYGDIYIQVVTPEGTTGDVTATVISSPVPDTLCIPDTLCSPVATFLYGLDCETDALSFTNLSTAGSAVFYEWQFPDGSTNDDFSPSWAYTREDTMQVLQISLSVLNSECDLTDFTTKNVFIPPNFEVFPADTVTVCNCEDTILTVPLQNVETTWQNGEVGDSLTATAEGWYWASMVWSNSTSGTGFQCEGIDSVFVQWVPCLYTETLDTSVCQGVPYDGVVYENDTILINLIPDDCVPSNMIEVTTNLTLNDTFYIEQEATICTGDTFNFEGMVLTEAGEYEALYFSVEGCDSMRHLSLSLYPLQFTRDSVFLCAGEVYQPGDITTDTELCEVNPDINFCDSTHCRNVIFLDTFYTTQEVTICELDTFDFAGTTLNSPGFYCQTFSSSLTGCDSTHCITLSVLDTALTLQSSEICMGESIIVGLSVYTESGTYIDTLVAENFCDSVVITNLTVHLLPEPDIEGNTPFCLGDSILLNAGSGFISYLWSNMMTTQTIMVGNSDTYFVIVENEFQCFNADTVITNAVSLLSSIDILSDFNGFPISCEGVFDGEIEATVNDGIAPYTFSWSNGTTTSNNANLAAGEYFVTISDALGCLAIDSTTLVEPEILGATINLVQPLCYSDANGSIELGTSGGVPPYRFALNNMPWQDQPIFTALVSQDYLLQIEDSNGCLWEEMVFLDEPDDLYLGISPDSSIVKLGEDISVEAHTNMADPVVIHWSPEEDFDCPDDCLDPVLLPLNSTTYDLYLENENGCNISDHFYVEVLKPRDVFIPNIFSPNADGTNDLFTIYAGSDVSRIATLKIFNRWGGLVFQSLNFPPNNQNLGWDGTFKGKTMASGVYVYLLEIEFIDGFTERYEGDLTIIR